MARNLIALAEPIYSPVSVTWRLEELTNFARKAAETINPSAIAAEIVHFESALREIEDAFDQFKAAVNKLKTEVLPTVFETNDTTSITVLGYRVTASAQVRATIRQDCKAEAIAWLEANGLRDIIDYDPRVNPSTLAATVRAEVEEGREFPDEIFNVFIYNNTSLTKAK